MGVQKTWSGITYDFDDLDSDDNRGYADLVTPGITPGGPKVRLYLAMIMDALGDAGQNLVSTSVTSATIGTGTKGPFTLGTDVPFQVGVWVLLVSDSAPTNWMLAQVTAKAGDQLTVSVPDSDHFNGSGSHSDWNISVSAPLGPQGPAGAGLAAVVDDTTPQLGGMLDINGFPIGDGTLELLKFVETPSAVNEITITNAATGNAPAFDATGDDTDIDLQLNSKGTGVIKGNRIRTWVKALTIAGAVEEKDYDVMLDLPEGFTIINARTQSKSGTCTLTWKIEAVALGGSANSVSTASDTQAHNTNNVTAAGNDVIGTVSSNVACNDVVAWFEIEGEL